MIQSTEEKTAGKLEANWEGPYIVIAKGGEDPYNLVDQDRKILSKQ